MTLLCKAAVVNLRFPRVRTTGAKRRAFEKRCAERRKRRRKRQSRGPRGPVPAPQILNLSHQLARERYERLKRERNERPAAMTPADPGADPEGGAA